MSLPEIFNTGLNSNVWGTGAWTFLHSITLTYPNDPTDVDKKTYKNFFETIGYLLPCNQCSNHYNDYLKENPIDDSVLENKLSFTKWLYNVHNNVNHILNKPKIDFDEFINQYYDMYSNYHSNDNNDIYNFIKNNILIIAIIIVIVCGFLYKLYKSKCS